MSEAATHCSIHILGVGDQLLNGLANFSLSRILQVDSSLDAVFVPGSDTCLCAGCLPNDEWEVRVASLDLGVVVEDEGADAIACGTLLAHDESEFSNPFLE